MVKGDNTILLIGDTKEYLYSAFASKMEDASYSIIRRDAKMAHVENEIEKANYVVLYLNDEVINDTALLTYVRDQTVDKDILLFIVGEEQEVQTLFNTIKEEMIEAIFYRPINTIEMVEFFDDFIQNYEPELKKRILVVDDSGTVLRNVRSWLGEKYIIEVANSGMMAIKNMTLRLPDLVLLDYEMPICDGPQVMEMIRAESEFEDVPIMFLTGRGDKDSVMKGLSLKPEGYLLKSQPPEELVQAVDDFFAARKATEKKKHIAKRFGNI